MDHKKIQIGERKDNYVAETDFWKIIKAVLKEIEKSEFDLAWIAVDVGHRNENLTIDAVGPEIFTYNQLIHLIAAAINSSAKIIHLPHQAVYLLSRLVGIVMNDILLTRDEISG